MQDNKVFFLFFLPFFWLLIKPLEAFFFFVGQACLRDIPKQTDTDGSTVHSRRHRPATTTDGIGTGRELTDGEDQKPETGSVAWVAG